MKASLLLLLPALCLYSCAEDTVGIDVIGQWLSNCGPVKQGELSTCELDENGVQVCQTQQSPTITWAKVQMDVLPRGTHPELDEQLENSFGSLMLTFMVYSNDSCTEKSNDPEADWAAYRIGESFFNNQNYNVHEFDILAPSQGFDSEAQLMKTIVHRQGDNLYFGTDAFFSPERSSDLDFDLVFTLISE